MADQYQIGFVNPGTPGSDAQSLFLDSMQKTSATMIAKRTADLAEQAQHAREVNDLMLNNVNQREKGIEEARLTEERQQHGQVNARENAQAKRDQGAYEDNAAKTFQADIDAGRVGEAQAYAARHPELGVQQAHAPRTPIPANPQETVPQDLQSGEGKAALQDAHQFADAGDNLGATKGGPMLAMMLRPVVAQRMNQMADAGQAPEAQAEQPQSMFMARQKAAKQVAAERAYGGADASAVKANEALDAQEAAHPQFTMGGKPVVQGEGQKFAESEEKRIAGDMAARVEKMAKDPRLSPVLRSDMHTVAQAIASMRLGKEDAKSVTEEMIKGRFGEAMARFKAAAASGIARANLGERRDSGLETELDHQIGYLSKLGDKFAIPKDISSFREAQNAVVSTMSGNALLQRGANFGLVRVLQGPGSPVTEGDMRAISASIGWKGKAEDMVAGVEDGSLGEAKIDAIRDALAIRLGLKENNLRKSFRAMVSRVVKDPTMQKNGAALKAHIASEMEAAGFPEKEIEATVSPIPDNATPFEGARSGGGKTASVSRPVGPDETPAQASEGAAATARKMIENDRKAKGM